MLSAITGIVLLLGVGLFVASRKAQPNNRSLYAILGVIMFGIGGIGLFMMGGMK